MSLNIFDQHSCGTQKTASFSCHWLKEWMAARGGEVPLLPEWLNVPPFCGSECPFLPTITLNSPRGSDTLVEHLHFKKSLHSTGGWNVVLMTSASAQQTFFSLFLDISLFSLLLQSISKYKQCYFSGLVNWGGFVPCTKEIGDCMFLFLNP